ncbi:MAG TPA: hypothetical protein VFE79_24695, partial [Paraburkholderia sp.]|nr:hypothetical protein [Paraburkholderia sp.]
MVRVKSKQQWLLAAAALTIATLTGFAAHRADAARTLSVSPQGKVAQVRQVVVKFDESMAPFGDANAAAPAQVRCVGGADNSAGGSADESAAGSARWIDDKTWAYDFKSDLGPGLRCSIDVNDGLKSKAG